MITSKRLPILRNFIGLVFCVVFILGCEEQSMQAHGAAGAAALARPVNCGLGQADLNHSCFGLSNSFYGHPNHYQRRNLPQAMRGAYRIEQVKNISIIDLKEMLKKKQLVAEEFKKGERYVAMRDSRIVQFDTFVSGLVIIIERYRIVDN